MSTADIEPDAASAPPASMKSGGRRFGDALFNALSVGSGLLIFVTLAAVAIFLTLESLPAIIASREFSGSADFSLIEYSLPLVFGTVLASAIALVIAIPISLGIALFISHFAPRRLASALGYMIDLLAAVPSVVYGLWGGVWLVPKLEPLYVFLNTYFGWIPLFAGEPTAPMRNLASASVVLAVMVLPIITAVSREVFLQTPRLQEEAALALGATRWETIRTVVLPFGRGGVVAASMLGLGRALGETMAVLMILAPGATFSLHILEVGRHNSIAANIASKQAEASGVDMSLLIFTGLVLFVLTFVINAIARWIVARSGPKS
ncbi:MULTISPECIES: phosphate ABC transporter permease subunit PstC [Brachybacterium]|uniref:Phosphate transport system permease protein n=3 Tax=Bacillati TaxID=1783272 RepID=A0A426SJ27_9MICO|nr:MULTISPECIES: phosphate ABC transporter permease subunit PstC [Brachybacterium]RRR18188.1 phosphate ABC transporter permease subunit PstC [Brachybacterium paraconglomeratum]GLI30288.1 phosphate transport system permease protein [Brachybacterium conglomeratum]GLK04826.1 phosphate transport system permease protein [Brachybacterium conglomeratum]HJF50246.1 phosphate ABC transporter permease subunit PstC [Brachybacterium paraconglomeratum]